MNEVTVKQVAEDWGLDDEKAEALAGAQIIFHDYWSGGYDGEAMTIYLLGGRLYECHGAHCSCYGLEGQWEPEETSIEALQIRDWYSLESYYFEGDTEQRDRFFTAFGIKRKKEAA